MTTVVGLKLQVAPGHFSEGRLQVRCVATISTGAEESNIAPAPAPVQLHRLAAASTPPPLDYNREALFLGKLLFFCRYSYRFISKFLSCSFSFSIVKKK